MKKKFSIPALLLGGLWILSSLACSKNNSEVTPPLAGGDTIFINSSAFSPDSLITGLGVNVTWRNNDAIIHKVVANDGSFNSGDLANGSHYTRKFTTLGEDYFYCEYHPATEGVVYIVTR